MLKYRSSREMFLTTGTGAAPRGHRWLERLEAIASTVEVALSVHPPIRPSLPPSLPCRPTIPFSLTSWHPPVIKRQWVWLFLFFRFFVFLGGEIH